MSLRGHRSSLTPEEQAAADAAGERLAAEALKTLTDAGLPEDKARTMIETARALGKALGEIETPEDDDVIVNVIYSVRVTPEEVQQWAKGCLPPMDDEDDSWVFAVQDAVRERLPVILARDTEPEVELS